MYKFFLLLAMAFSIYTMNNDCPINSLGRYAAEEPKNIFEAAAQGNISKIKEFLEKDDVNARDPYSGDTALKIASFYGKTALVEFLLKKGANPNIQDNAGDTALMAVVFVQPIAISHLLLKYGANPNTQNQNGETALMKAVWYTRKDIIEQLLAANVNLDLTDKNGTSARMIVERLSCGGHYNELLSPIKKLFEDHKAKKKNTP